jgi:hypothetical protein
MSGNENGESERLGGVTPENLSFKFHPKMTLYNFLTPPKGLYA